MEKKVNAEMHRRYRRTVDQRQTETKFRYFVCEERIKAILV